MDKKPSIFWQKTKELFLNTGIVIILIIIIRTFIISPFEVEGLSMYETLHDRDYILIDKLTYRFSEPRRGDITVLRPPHIKERTYFVKRIIGLPGDIVSFEDGYVFINGKRLEESYIPAFYRTRLSISSPTTITVPPDSYFVMGDNRDHSSDSRSWMVTPAFRDNFNEEGAIPKKYITGKVRVIAFNLSQIFKNRWEIIKNPTY